MKKLFFLLLPVVGMIAIVFFALRYQAPAICIGNRGVAAVGSIRYDVLLAVTPAEWEQGLSGHPQLPRDEGMLFLFPTAQVRAFWMKDMNFPLDIIWIDKEWKIVGIEHHATPESYPRTFTSPSPIARVLEISALPEGDSQIKIGDSIQFHCL